MKSQILEEKMIKYKDLLSVPVRDNNDPLIIISPNCLPNGYVKPFIDMKLFTKGKILVRRTVFEKLKEVNRKLRDNYPSLSIYITYGFRTYRLQKIYFQKELKHSISKYYFYDPIALYEEVHRSIAVPEVAGHPTGGAVDIIIINKKNNSQLDFGSSLYDFSTKKRYTFWPDLSSEAKKNRFLIRSLMMDEGFAPFDGEWWHFSYGDREWAFYYKKKFALYDQVACD